MKLFYFLLFILLFVVAACADWDKEKSGAREPASLREMRPDNSPIDQDANPKDNAPLQ